MFRHSASHGRGAKCAPSLFQGPTAQAAPDHLAAARAGLDDVALWIYLLALLPASCHVYGRGVAKRVLCREPVKLKESSTACALPTSCHVYGFGMVQNVL